MNPAIKSSENRARARTGPQRFLARQDSTVEWEQNIVGQSSESSCRHGRDENSDGIHAEYREGDHLGEDQAVYLAVHEREDRAEEDPATKAEDRAK